jgi:hypothetical protein
MKRLSVFAIPLLTLFLAGCPQTMTQVVDDVRYKDFSGWHGQQPVGTDVYSDNLLAEGACPAVDVTPDLKNLNDFVNNAQPSGGDLIAGVEIQGASGTCKINEKSVVVDIKVKFAGKLGPQGRQNSGDIPSFSYPYFVAVTGPMGNIMAKEVFAASMNFVPGEDTHFYDENLQQHIPIEDKAVAGKYHVVVGFQLSPEQLAYNRKIIEQRRKALEAGGKKVPPLMVPKSLALQDFN